MTENRELLQGKGSNRQKRKASSCSFRLEPNVKERLQVVAGKQGRTLSSLIERTLNCFLASYEKGNLDSHSVQQDRRQHPRKDTLIPARWRVGNKDDFIEYDVIVKNISTSGAYTFYSNGCNFHLLEKLKAQPFRLYIKLPGVNKPVELDCEARRFHITEDSTSVGIEFVNTLMENNLFPQTEER
jgi:predicted DNA-binding protein